jgi:diguanylate cyclase (GGDEF)-like protein/PAS domain S-box-containing protein
VWKPAVLWSGLGMLAGQVAIGTGLVPSSIPAPPVHGLGLMSFVSVAYAIRIIGLQRAATEQESAERAAAQAAVAASERRLRSLVQNGSDIIFVLDEAGLVRFASQSVRTLGVSPEAMNGTLARLRIHPDDRAATAAEFGAMLAVPGAQHRMERRVCHVDGSYRWYDIVAHNLLGDPAVAGIVVNMRETTERRRFQDHLAHTAYHDSLTGLVNRRAFLERLGTCLATRRPGDRVAVLFCDVDRFKLVNDRRGHAAGDRVLVAIAERLRACVGADDVVGRIAGDEFSVLLEQVGTEAEAEAIAARVTELMREPFVVGGHEAAVSLSIGVALSTEDDTVETLLSRADLAMYAAKREGGGRLRHADGRDAARFLDRVELEQDLKRAAERDELRLVYQPIVDAATGSLRGVEALVRWEHPTRGLLGPGAFIGLAEESGLILGLGAWVMEEACRTAATWPPLPGTDHATPVNVNVSAVQLADPGFLGVVQRALASSGLRRGALVLEITESCLVDDDGGELLTALREMGVPLVIDDFGTGFSSLAYLSSFRCHGIKIDRSFVANVGTEAGARMVGAIVELARAMDLKVVAEGVETVDQLDAVVALGCEYAQGYLFARPEPADVCAERFWAPPAVTPPGPAPCAPSPSSTAAPIATGP